MFYNFMNAYEMFIIIQKVFSFSWNYFYVKYVGDRLENLLPLHLLKPEEIYFSFLFSLPVIYTIRWNMPVELKDFQHNPKNKIKFLLCMPRILLSDFPFNHMTKQGKNIILIHSICVWDCTCLNIYLGKDEYGVVMILSTKLIK